MPATQSCQQRNFCHVLFPSQLQPPVAVLGVPAVLCHRKVAFPSHLSPEQQKDQCDGRSRGTKASKQHLGLIHIQDGFTELCSASSQQIHRWGFHPFLDTDAEESRDEERVDSIFMGGTFKCGHEGPCAHQQQPKLCSPKLSSRIPEHALGSSSTGDKLKSFTK